MYRRFFMNKHEKNIACCFTGHRKIPQRKTEQIQERLRNEIVTAIQNGYTFFYAGGAIGFDTMAAQAVLELKAQYPHIKLILVLPCVNQTDGWEQSDIDEYERIRVLADEVIYTSEEYKKGCMHKRNRYLVDHSSLCICYMTRKSGGTAYTVEYATSNKSGGTAYTVEYATSNGLKIINISK